MRRHPLWPAIRDQVGALLAERRRLEKGGVLSGDWVVYLPADWARLEAIREELVSYARTLRVYEKEGAA